jgi:hypothetical protein
MTQGRRSRSPAAEEGTMQYVLLVCGDDSEQLTDEESAERYAAFEAAQAELEARGAFRDRRRLRPTSSATTVRVRNGELVLSDGPFAETKEQIAGYYLVECSDQNEAIELAALIPAVKYSMVEVRPVWEM